MKKILYILIALFTSISVKAESKADKDSVTAANVWTDSAAKEIKFGQILVLKTRGIDSLIKANEHIILLN